MAVSLVLFIIGLLVLFRGVNWGSQAANAYLLSQGGMDTKQFMLIFQEDISIYKWIGGILSVIGGLGIVKLIA